MQHLGSSPPLLLIYMSYLLALECLCKQKKKSQKIKLFDRIEPKKLNFTFFFLEIVRFLNGVARPNGPT